ncbi:hypothetical protein ACO22_08092 [Paracoccidioides brasiliensis]|uniref:Uncharacterized protein n=1 Tax=Paracoccidioides brasiliensis TaxID=121759 RepID=A0A1D2J2T7_PARBR|nr:hypothetical protein ACO22_08092 [Paracoccidioides brasiliensis]ODH45512.1 hypothetical protein GX48_08413 [Paracoccidioides brasiliensis]
MEERRPWPEIERCFPERTESALRQRASTLRKHERGMRTAESATPESQQHLPAPEALLRSLLIFLLLGGDPSSAQVYITGEGMPPAHRTAMRSPLLLYAIRSHGRMIPTLLSLLLAAAPCFNGWREHPGTSTPVTIPISWYTQRAPSASRSIVLLTLKHDPSVPSPG